MASDKKFILYIGGGVMAGIFGAGVVTSLEEENIYPYIEAVYGSSVGAIIGAYFLANQSKLGSSIFYEDLLHNFITPLYIPLGIYDRFWNRFIKKVPLSEIRNPIDINYILDIITGRKKLNIESIKQKRIPFYIHVLNTDSLKTEFINVSQSDNFLNVLKSAISAVPYYFPADLKFIDGEIIDPFPLGEIIKQYPDQKIIAVLNIMPHRFIRRSIKGIIEGWVASLMYSLKIWGVYIKRDYYAKGKIKTKSQHKNVLIIFPDNKLRLWPNTVNRDKLLVAYEAGRQAGLSFIKDSKL